MLSPFPLPETIMLVLLVKLFTAASLVGSEMTIMPSFNPLPLLLPFDPVVVELVLFNTITV